jgi:hypothetical protein
MFSTPPGHPLRGSATGGAHGADGRPALSVFFAYPALPYDYRHPILTLAQA